VAATLGPTGQCDPNPDGGPQVPSVPHIEGCEVRGVSSRLSPREPRNSSANRAASQGCIVLDRAARQAIADCGGGSLLVLR